MQQAQKKQYALQCVFGNCHDFQTAESEFCEAHESMPVETAEQISDQDMEEIARHIAQGYTSGLIDRNNHRIAWNLQADIFKY